MQLCGGFCREIAKQLWEGLLIRDQEYMLHNVILEVELSLAPLLFTNTFPPN